MSAFGDLLKKIKENLKSGITVSLVSIPLSVSLAVASQTSPVVGIITAIWAGMMSGLFGGSNYNIVGPTGALSGTLAAFSISQGTGSLSMLAITSGIIIFIAFALKLERYMVFIPKSAVQGFTLGVAFVIGLNQLNSAFGLKVTAVHEKFIDNLMESFKAFHTVNLGSSVVFVVFLIGLFIFAFTLPKLPGAIILTPPGILLGYLSLKGKIPLAITTLGQKYPNMDARLYTSWPFKFNSKFIGASFTVAIVGILETMLSAKIADGMTKTKHNKSREMFGLAIANIVSGIFGGIPATSALARTSLNIKTGATYRISAVISSISIIIISFLLLPFFKYIPMAVIASILVFVAIRMVEVHEMIIMFKHDLVSFFIAIAVGAITVYEDPIYGILFGTALSLILFMNKLSDGQYDIQITRGPQQDFQRVPAEDELSMYDDDRTIIYTIKGQLAYINALSHVTRFEKEIGKNRNIVLRLRELYAIDLDGIEAFDEIIFTCKKNGNTVSLCGASSSIVEKLRCSQSFNELMTEGRVFEKTSEALRSFSNGPNEL